MNGGLRVWVGDDVARLLMLASAAAGRYPSGDFRSGYQAAVADLALGFGVAVDVPAVAGGGSVVVDGELVRVHHRGGNDANL